MMAVSVAAVIEILADTFYIMLPFRLPPSVLMVTAVLIRNASLSSTRTTATSSPGAGSQSTTR